MNWKPCGAATTVAFVAAVALAGPAISAETYPVRPVRMVVGFPPGGAADILARIIGNKLFETWGQNVIIDNRPGAGSTLGAEIAARAAPDGYTLMFVSSSYAASAGLYRKLSYDPVEAFSPISLVASTPQILLASPSVSAKSLGEVLALAKASPGKFNYGSAGNGSTTHLAGELLWSMAGVKMTHVPYKGGGPALIDTIAGHIQYMFFTLPPALPHVRAGRVKAIAVTSLKRSPALPDVQAAAEVVPGYEATNWYAVLAPVGVSKAIVDRIVSGVREAVKDPAVMKAITNAGADPLGGPPNELSRYLRAEITKWSRVIKEAGVPLQ
jgi:tripartite-type tricarboxylate transporter receptor subunit TctC